MVEPQKTQGKQSQVRSLKLILGSYRYMLLSSLTGLVLGCTNQGFLTPPTQNLGNSLNSLAADEEPRFSYNGRYIVFASDRLGHRGIFLYDVPQQRLVALPGLNNPAVLQDQPDISADGRSVVYISEARGKPDVYVYDRQTRQSQLITGNFLGDVRHPTISGDGRFVAFQSNRTGQWNIEIFDRGPGARVTPSDELLPTPAPQNQPSAPGPVR